MLIFFSLFSLAYAQIYFPHPDGRVTGGMEAQPHSAPYTVSIQVKQSSGYVHLCGGSIIDKNWVVTAAHCIGSSSSNLIIKAGRHNLNVQENTEQERSIDYFKKHDLYLGGIMPFDIALFYTKTPFQWTTAVQPIELTKTGPNPSGQATLFGWGSTSATNTPSYPDTLRTITVPIVEYNDCAKVLGTGATLHETNLCTGPLTGGFAACTADSGGPLVQNNKLIGIVSWGGTPCGQPNSPSVYVKVVSFSDWIEDVIKNYK